MSGNNYYDPYNKTDVMENVTEFKPEYAGFLIRLVASFVDGIILGVLSTVFFFIMIFGLAFVAGASDSSSSAGDPLSAAFGIGFCMIYIIVIVIYWLYNAWFESSAYMGTPGKILCGLKVVDEQGDRITFGKASLRFIMKQILNMFLYIGSLAIIFTGKKQGIYDMIASTYVVKK